MVACKGNKRMHIRNILVQRISQQRSRCTINFLYWNTSFDRVCTTLSNQNSRTFEGQFVIFQGMKITEVQGSAILTHIFPLYKAHITAQETATCSTETALGRPPHMILMFKNKAELRHEVPICILCFSLTLSYI